jgi:hypothetical protein
MKRKLKINRETLRNLVDESMQDVAGGARGSVINTQCDPSCIRQCSQSCASCAVTCTLLYSVCVHCQL